MDFQEVLRERRSIRSFKDQSVSETLLQEILEASISAPSAGNLQSYKIIVVTSKQIKNELSEAALDQQFISQSPVVLVFCTNAKKLEWRYGSRGRELYSVQDATIACSFAMLAATALGLGSVWVGAFDERAVHEIIGSPIGLRPVAILPIGYAAERPSKPSRGSLKNMVDYV